MRAASAGGVPLQVGRLRCEHLEDPLGIDTPVPRLSWQVRSDRRGARQEAYQLLVASTPDLLADGVGDVWDSGRIAAADCVLVPYGGPRLRSRQRVHWTVRVTDDADVTAVAPGPAWWEMGLLDEADWQAAWVASAGAPEAGAVTYLRTALHVDGPVRRARAYATALGLYDLHCNGRRVGDARFTPGWTDYGRRLQYQTYDLTDLLQRGDNVLGALLADGWYAGRVGFLGQREHYGDTPQLLVQVEVSTDDGRVVCATGEGWSAAGGPVRASDMLLGEAFDARRVERDWCTVGGGGDAWRPVRRTAGTLARRVTSPAPSVRVLQQLRPVSVSRSGPDTHLVDVGQNMVGWLRLRLDGPAGTQVRVRHAEILDGDGALYVDNLRGATATDTYVLDGRARVLEPVFTFHGFRYAEVSGHAGDLSPADVSGVVCGSAVEQTGDFSCSDERVNRLHANIVWGARGNFLDVPTDCPQRDERLGWMGDAQVFAPTACALFDMAAFYAKWLDDVVDAQSAAGGFPDVAPRVVDLADGAPGWGDAGVIVPWVTARWYGDERLLERCYPAMRRWVAFIHEANPDLRWIQRRGHDMGDWLAIEAETDKDLVATAFFAHSTRLVADAAAALGRTTEAAELQRLADGVRAAFVEDFVLPEGRLVSGTQTAYALALRFDLLPHPLRAKAVEHLVDDIEARKGHLSTGFLGVAHLLPALTEGGRIDVAYRLLFADAFPSWLYAVAAGATTIWERWDGWTADLGFQDPEMNSFNHYAFGAVGEWLYRAVGGVSPDASSARRVEIAPRPHADLDWAQASYGSPYGDVACRWERLPDGSLDVAVRVPVGTTARVTVPAALADDVRESGRPLDEASLVQVVDRLPDAVVVTVGSGRYRFTAAPGSTQ